MRINPFIYGVFVLVVFLGVIYGFQGAGVWSTSGKIGAEGERIQPSSSDVNSIKGWMTLEQVSTTFGVPVDDILAEFGVPQDTPPTTALKELESDTFDVASLRTWLAEYQATVP